ncbi:hypothetical protein [Cohnella sp. 56]|uniref:hypothetical protein n=1 Tax=Cohnella sp. 56 TaxID=3113722 RepID=UPI0030E95F0D
MIVKLLSIILKVFFYRLPAPLFSAEEVKAFSRIYETAVSTHTEIVIESSFVKSRFIQYVCATREVVVHGSNHSGIDEFIPKRQTLFDGKYVNAVFATKDAVWGIFYAVFDRRKLVGSFRNACLKLREDDSSYYFFSLTPNTLDKKPWTTGTIYFLPQKYFDRSKKGIVSFDEWTSQVAVKPLTQLQVGPQDFGFLKSISWHKPSENIIKSWLLYKYRIPQTRR